MKLDPAFKAWLWMVLIIAVVCAMSAGLAGSDIYDDHCYIVTVSHVEAETVCPLVPHAE